VTEQDLMEPSYLDINIDDKTQDIIVIDVKPHRRCLNWVIKKAGYDSYKWKRKWRVWKWYLCYACFMTTLIATIVVLKLPLEVSVRKDKAGNCPLYSHE